MTINHPGIAEQMDAVIAEVHCEDRGEGLRPRHVYLDGSGRCQCGDGPDLMKERMR